MGFDSCGLKIANKINIWMKAGEWHVVYRVSTPEAYQLRIRCKENLLAMADDSSDPCSAHTKTKTKTTHHEVSCETIER